MNPKLFIKIERSKFHEFKFKKYNEIRQKGIGQINSRVYMSVLLIVVYIINSSLY